MNPLSRHPLIGPLSAVALVITWSSGFVGAELAARAEAAPVTILAWRFVVLTTILAAFGAVRRIGWPSWAAWRRHLVLGALCQAIYLLLVFEGVAHGVNGGMAALIASLQPMLVATVAGPLLGEHASPTMIVGLVLGLIGVGTAVGGDLGGGTAHWWACLLPTLGMLCLASGTVLTRRWSPPEGLLQSFAMQSTVSLLLLMSAAVATGRATPPMESDFWAAVAWLVVLASIGGYGMYILVAKTEGATVVSTLLYLTPPTTMLWVWLMFGTPVKPLGLLGMLVSGIGVVLVLRGRVSRLGRRTTSHLNQRRAPAG